MKLLDQIRSRTPQTASGERIYAVGDVHGRHDLLKKLLNIIIESFPLVAPRPKRMMLLFLGDVIDRGPESAECVSKLRRLTETRGVKLLMGNHEDMMLASIEGNAAAQDAWLQNGGLETLKSYNIAPPAKHEDAFDFGERLERSVPQNHVAFLKSLDTSYRSGSYFFAHAGVRPGISIDKQDREDLFSIRSEFTESEKWHGAVVVHGHSIVGEVEIHENRIACDTGAYRSDTLSCVCLQEDEVSVLTT